VKPIKKQHFFPGINGPLFPSTLLSEEKTPGSVRSAESPFTHLLSTRDGGAGEKKVKKFTRIAIPGRVLSLFVTLNLQLTLCTQVFSQLLLLLLSMVAFGSDAPVPFIYWVSSSHSTLSDFYLLCCTAP